MASMTAKVPISETGTSIIGKIIARQSCKKNKTTMATRCTPQREDLVDRLADERRGVVSNDVIDPFGEGFALHPGLWTVSATSSALVPGSW